jgi:hypothetical protein
MFELLGRAFAFCGSGRVTCAERRARRLAQKGQGQADHRQGGARLSTTTSKIQKIIAKNANKNNRVKFVS